MVVDERPVASAEAERAVKHLLQWTAAVVLAALTLQWAVSVVRASAVVLLAVVGSFVAIRAWLNRRNRW